MAKKRRSSWLRAQVTIVRYTWKQPSVLVLIQLPYRLIRECSRLIATYDIAGIRAPRSQFMRQLPSSAGISLCRGTEPHRDAAPP